MRSPKITVPQPDQQLVELQKADAARAQADRISQIQSVLRGQTARTRRRYGVFDQAVAMMTGVAPSGGVAAAGATGVGTIAAPALIGSTPMTGSGQRSGFGGGGRGGVGGTGGQAV